MWCITDSYEQLLWRQSCLYHKEYGNYQKDWNISDWDMANYTIEYGLHDIYIQHQEQTGESNSTHKNKQNQQNKWNNQDKTNNN